MLPFRRRLTLDQRRREFNRVSSSDLVPTILERGGGLDTPRLDREKYLVPLDLTGAQMGFVVRRRLRLDASQSLFLVCGGQLVGATTTVRELRDRTPSEDGFLYLTYTLENTFGGGRAHDSFFSSSSTCATSSSSSVSRTTYSGRTADHHSAMHG